jgi:cysteinyl-tRNA synthetase
LGESFDIHGGGIENQFPHHEDEIAQAEAATGKPFAKYWLHNNMVTVGGQKMGKSLGNFITLKDAFEKWDPMVLRLFILQSHYRSPLDFSDEALGAAQEGLVKFSRLTERLLASPSREITKDKDGKYFIDLTDLKEPSFVTEARLRFEEAMSDDFNTPMAVAALFDLTREANRYIDIEKQPTLSPIVAILAELGFGVLGITDLSPRPHNEQFWQAMRSVMGLTSNLSNLARHATDLAPRKTSRESDALVDALVNVLIDLRNDARKSKNFAQADAIRKRLDEIGILLEDTPEGTKWRFK